MTLGSASPGRKAMAFSSQVRASSSRLESSAIRPNWRMAEWLSGWSAAIRAYCSPAWANSPVRKSRSAESIGDGFCSAPCPKQAQGASTTKSARQISEVFIVRTREREDGVASKAYQPEHDPEKWVPVFGKDHAPPRLVAGERRRRHAVSSTAVRDRRSRRLLGRLLAHRVSW